jgi:hypothetical protein
MAVSIFSKLLSRSSLLFYKCLTFFLESYLFFCRCNQSWGSHKDSGRAEALPRRWLGLPDETKKIGKKIFKT